MSLIISLRELISNSTDALNKNRYKSITDPEKIEAQPNFCIKTVTDKTNFTLTFEGSGIGMTKNELVNNSGKLVKLWYQSVHGGHGCGR